MLVPLCKYLHVGDSAQVSPCWYLHAGDSVQVSPCWKLCASYCVLVTLREYLHAGDSVQATLRKLTKSSARKNPSPCFREKQKMREQTICLCSSRGVGEIRESPGLSRET